MDKIKTFCANNTATFKFLRTIFQGIVGVLASNIDYLVGLRFSGETKVIIVALVMAVLSPLMAKLGEQE